VNADDNKKQKLAAALEVNLAREAARDDKAIQEAVALVVDDLTESNAHTIAALLESQYSTGYDMDKVERAYKAAQWELFGTR
jgi:hypothetical protein